MQKSLDQAPQKTRASLSLATREAIWAYIFLAVPLLFFLILRIWPAFQSFYLSLFTWHVDPAEREYLGLGYYHEMLREPRLHRALLNTLLYTLIIVPAQLVLGLGIAMLLNTIDRLRAVFRAIYFAPFVIMPENVFIASGECPKKVPFL